MRVRIEQNLLKILFFRPELITTIKDFLSTVISIEDIPKFYQKKAFFNYLTKNSINIKITDNEKKEDKGEEETEREMNLNQIIEKDDLELLQQEFENVKNLILKDSFFEVEKMNIPILHY